jgi:hypothetical protein
MNFSRTLPFLFYGILLCSVQGCLCYVRSAHEDHYPHVWDTESKRAVVWTRGSMLQHVLWAEAIRVTDNRVRFIPAGWSMVSTLQNMSTFSSCVPHSHALCYVTGHGLSDSMGVGEGSMVFPTLGTDVWVHGTTSHSCLNGYGRTSMATNRSAMIYDISVCDVVDGSLSVLFVDDMVHLMHVDINSPMYVIAGVLVVIVIVLITQNLAVDILSDTTNEPPVSAGVCVFISLLLTLCSCILPGFIAGRGPGPFVPFVTELDRFYFFTVVCYMTTHCSLWIGSHTWNWLSRNTFPGMSKRSRSDEYIPLVFIEDGVDKQVVTNGFRVGHLHSVNFMVSALFLAIFSTHGTIETVLTSPLLFVFMFRTIFKSYAVENSSSKPGSLDTYVQVVFEPLLITFDIVVVGTTHIAGTQALAETSMHANSSFLILFFIAHTLAYEGNRTRKRRVEL